MDQDSGIGFVEDGVDITVSSSCFEIVIIKGEEFGIIVAVGSFGAVQCLCESFTGIEMPVELGYAVLGELPPERPLLLFRFFGREFFYPRISEVS